MAEIPNLQIDSTHRYTIRLVEALREHLCAGGPVKPYITMIAQGYGLSPSGLEKYVNRAVDSVLCTGERDIAEQIIRKIKKKSRTTGRDECFLYSMSCRMTTYDLELFFEAAPESVPYLLTAVEADDLRIVENCILGDGHGTGRAWSEDHITILAYCWARTARPQLNMSLSFCLTRLMLELAIPDRVLPEEAETVRNFCRRLLNGERVRKDNLRYWLDELLPWAEAEGLGTIADACELLMDSINGMDMVNSPSRDQSLEKLIDRIRVLIETSVAHDAAACRKTRQKNGYWDQPRLAIARLMYMNPKADVPDCVFFPRVKTKLPRDNARPIGPAAEELETMLWGGLMNQNGRPLQKNNLIRVRQELNNQ